MRAHRSLKRQLGWMVWLPLFIFSSCFVVLAETRAIWVVRHAVTTPSGVQKIVADAQQAGLYTLFVQVRGRGDAYYKTNLVPPGERIDSEFDPLQAFIDLGHSAGLSIHAWVNVYLTWYPDRPPPPDHVLLTHPDWFMMSSDGVDMGQLDQSVDLVSRGVEGRYMSPAHPAVSRHLLTVIEEIITRYDVDGIHLDYVRYPNEHYDYSPLAQSGFWAATNLDPPKEKDALTSQVWNRWRSSRVTGFVRQLKQLIDRTKPNVELSAAVKPDIEMAYYRYGQNWVHWMNRRYLDFVVPMFYTGSTDSIVARMRTARKYVQRGRVYAGLGAWNQGTAATLEQIDVVEELRLNGFSLFSYDTLSSSPDLARNLKRRFGKKRP